MKFALLSTLLYSKPPGLPILNKLGNFSHIGCGSGGCISWPGCDNEHCRASELSTSFLTLFREGIFQGMHLSFDFIHSMNQTFLKCHHLSNLEFQAAFRLYGRNFKSDGQNFLEKSKIKYWDQLFQSTCIQSTL